MGITVYTKSGCPYCAAALKFLDEQGSSFQEVNVSLQPEKIEELIKMSGGRRVPVIVEDSQVKIGFNGGG